MTSSTIKADDNLRSLKKDERNCLFPEENSDLLLHKQYSYFNCKFECALTFAYNEVYKKHGKKCQPWFFPIINGSAIICDPWTSKSFFQIMSKEIPDSFCSQCLPDCGSTFYESSNNIKPLEKCGASHFGVSQFCKFDLNTRSPIQEYMISQFVKEITNNYEDQFQNKVPKYLTDNPGIKSYGYNIFNKSIKTYNSFVRDTAVVEIIYQKSTLVQFESHINMTWIDYLSAVGGLLGLVLGMGFFSFFELIWLCLRILSRKLAFTKCIS